MYERYVSISLDKIVDESTSYKAREVKLRASKALLPVISTKILIEEKDIKRFVVGLEINILLEAFPVR